jgi:N-acylneuraminate cytidylyltransferase
VEGGGLHLRSQELPPAYVVNGALYLIAPEDLRKRRTFFGADMVPLVMNDPAESIDIDSEWDWKVAETALAMGGR